MITVSIDIGSTWTKGAAFKLVDSELILLRRTARPTSVNNLAEAFFQVLGHLADHTDAA